MSTQLNKNNLSLYQQKYLLEDAYSKFQENSAVDISSLLVYYAAYSGNSLQTFQDNLSVPSSKAKKSPWRWDRPVVPNRRYGTLCCLISQKNISSRWRRKPEITYRILMLLCWSHIEVGTVNNPLKKCSILMWNSASRSNEIVCS